MSNPADDNSNIGSVSCGECGKRFEAQLQERAGEVLCPDCFSPVRVPARGEMPVESPADIENEPVAETVPPPDPHSYSLSATEADDRPQRPPQPKRRRRAGINCEECGARLQPELRATAYNFTCPDCMSVNVVPAAVDVPKKKKRKRKPSAATPDVDTGDAIPAEREHRNPFEAMSDIRREETAPPPKSTFFTNVFQIPWRRDVLAKWIMVSLGFAGLGFFVALILWFIADGTLLAVPFVFLPTVFLALGTGSYAVSGFLTILEETANGSDEITGWNDGGWKDAVSDAIPPVFLLSITAAVAYGIARGFSAWVDPSAFWPVFGVSLCLLYPIILLSSLQAGSIWALLTIPVLKTLVTNLWHWLVYYALVLVIAGAIAVPVFFGVRSGGLFAPLILSAPFLAAGVFIIARLTGRLAWRTLIRDDKDDARGPSDDVPKPKKRRKRPPQSDGRSPANSAFLPKSVPETADGFD